MGDFVILVENARFDLHPFFFDNGSIAECKKAFRYLFQEPWRNKNTIARLGEYLQQKAEEAKEAHAQAALKIARCVRVCPEIERAERNAKIIYERYTKKLVTFEYLKSQKLKI